MPAGYVIRPRTHAGVYVCVSFVQKLLGNVILDEKVLVPMYEIFVNSLGQEVSILIKHIL